MQPVCVFIIIVLGFTALWLLLDESNKASTPTEYYPSGGTALPPSVRMAARNAGPLPLHSSDLIYPPRNPVANYRIPRVWQDVPGEGGPVQAGPQPVQEDYEGALGGPF